MACPNLIMKDCLFLFFLSTKTSENSWGHAFIGNSPMVVTELHFETPSCCVLFLANIS